MQIQVGEYLCTETESALITKYGFKVRDDNGQFVVTDPAHKKLGKMSGGNLRLLLTNMVNARLKLEAYRPNNGKVKATVTTTPKTAVEGSTAPETESPVLPQPETVDTTTAAPETVSDKDDDEEGRDYARQVLYEDPDSPAYKSPDTESDKAAEYIMTALPNTTPDTITGVVLDDSGGKVKKPKKAKSTPRDPSKLKFLSAFKLWLLYPDKEPPFIRDKLIAQGIDAKDSSVEMLHHMCTNCVRAMVELEFVTQAQMKNRRNFILAEMKAKEEENGNNAVC